MSFTFIPVFFTEKSDSFVTRYFSVIGKYRSYMAAQKNISFVITTAYFVILYFTAGAVLVSSMAWLEGEQFSKFEDDYLESGSNRGITVEITHWDMGNGFPVTTYSVFEN